MIARPIIFSAPMVRALLAGSKTQTRRVMNPQPAEWAAQVIDITKPTFDEDQGRWGQWETEWSHDTSDGRGEPLREVWRPLKGLRYAPGDRLYVREAYRCNGWASDFATVIYRANVRDSYTEMTKQWPVADHKYLRPSGKWRPSIHMPRWASRLTLTVMDMRVERLQDISAQDCWHEGIPCSPDVNPVHEYLALWNSLHGPDAWDANPWVVAVSFTVAHGNIDAAPT